MSETGLPTRMLHDRVLVDVDAGLGEGRSSSGIPIPGAVASDSLADSGAGLYL